MNMWVGELMNEWMNEWVYEWVNEWMNEWMRKRKRRRYREEGRQGGCMSKEEWVSMSDLLYFDSSIEALYTIYFTVYN